MSYPPNIDDDEDGDVIVTVELGKDGKCNQFETDGALATKMSIPNQNERGRGYVYLAAAFGINGLFWMVAFWVFFIVIGFKYWGW